MTNATIFSRTNLRRNSLKRNKIIIGSSDKIDFPELTLTNVPCKIDTGAMTSSIHCHHVKLIEKNGEDYVTFKLLDPSHPLYQKKALRAKQFEERRIKNSFGQSEYRYVITTKVILFGKEIEAEFTLADRERMRYPVLLGKKLLKGNFIVDVSKRNLSHKKKAQEL